MEKVKKNNVEKKDKEYEKKQKTNHQAHVSFSIKMDIQQQRDGHHYLRKQRNNNFLNLKKNRYHPFLNHTKNKNQISQKILKKYSYHKHELNNKDDNDHKKISIYERGEPFENNEILMEVKHNALLPTKGREIAFNDQDGTYRFQLCKFFQQGHGCLDGRNCFFAHLDL